MRFTFAELKKTIVRRQGEPHLVPFLLRPGDLADGLAALVALFESFVGRERAYFPEDRPAELIGDYRLARCLATTLGEWYEWRAPAWPEGATDAEAAALAAAGIGSPGALRLALYDFVNEVAGGYLAGDERDAALDTFAARLGLARSTLDDLLRLDAAPQAVLERLTDAPPAPAALAARYNQRAVEVILANASTVEWVIAPEGSAEGLGTLVKRVCFLARRMGVQYDVAFDPSGESPPANSGVGARSIAPTQQDALPRVAERRAPYSAASPADLQGVHAPPSRAPAMNGRDGGHDVPRPLMAGMADADMPTLDAAGRPLVITLYGPQELTGAPAQYGERLARLCRALLGYRRDEAAPGRAAFAGMALRGTARVYLHGRPLAFTLDDRLLRLLTPPASPAPRGERGPGGEDSYDSSLERRLAEEFATLAREGAAAGWRLEREPEPVLVGDTILIPDFALRRGDRRVFLEIAGYWRPGYRERKLRKLAALRGALALILAAPESAREEFAPLAGAFPLLWYRDYLSAPALVALLAREYDDFAARLTQLDAPRVRAEVALRGRIPPTEAYALLRCYTRGELARTLARLAGGDDALVWIDGVGLCAPAWRDALLAELRALVEGAPGARLPLATLAARAGERRPDLRDLPPSALEALTGLAGMRVTHASLFEAEVALGDTSGEGRETTGEGERLDVPRGPKMSGPGPQPRRAAKRNPTGTRYAMTPFFTSESPADDPGGSGRG